MALGLLRQERRRLSRHCLRRGLSLWSLMRMTTCSGQSSRLSVAQSLVIDRYGSLRRSGEGGLGAAEGADALAAAAGVPRKARWSFFEMPGRLGPVSTTRFEGWRRSAQEDY